MKTSPASRKRYNYNLAMKLLFLAFTTAHGDIVRAKDVTRVLATSDSNIYKVEFKGPYSRAALTVALAPPFLDTELEILDFKVRDIFLSDIVFSYDPDQPDAAIIRMMTSWLEEDFLVHRAKIVAHIRAQYDDLPLEPFGDNRS